MTVSLFPRLDPLCVDQCLENLDGLMEDAGRPLTEDRLPAGTGWAAIGGGQVSMGILAELRTLILEAASECGFPERGSVNDRARFDSLATAVLASFEPLASGEADRDDVWAFITTVLVPDIVAWRFANRSAERFEGGVRNALQRLWMRAWALDAGPEAGEERWKLVEFLTEDALVQLTERPSIGADRNLSLSIARAWARTAELVGASRMEDVMRRAIIDLRIRNEVQMLTLLDDTERQEQVDRIFARAAGLDVPDETRPAIVAHEDADDDDHRHSGATEGNVGHDVIDDDGDDARTADSEKAKTGELAIQHAMLKLMLDGREWSNAELKDRLANILPLTEADRGVGARPAEELWENRVNNALGRARASSLYAKGFVENRGHGVHAITELGAAYIGDVEHVDRLLGDQIPQSGTGPQGADG